MHAEEGRAPDFAIGDAAFYINPDGSAVWIRGRGNYVVRVELDALKAFLETVEQPVGPVC